MVPCGRIICKDNSWFYEVVKWIKWTSLESNDQYCKIYLNIHIWNSPYRKDLRKYQSHSAAIFDSIGKLVFHKMCFKKWNFEIRVCNIRQKKIFFSKHLHGSLKEKITLTWKLFFVHKSPGKNNVLQCNFHYVKTGYSKPLLK